MAQEKWWVTDASQDDQDTEEIKIEVEKINAGHVCVTRSNLSTACLDL